MRITFIPHYPKLKTWYHPCVNGKKMDVDITFNEFEDIPYHCTCNLYDMSHKLLAYMSIPAVKGREKEALDALKPIIRHTLKGLGY